MISFLVGRNGKETVSRLASAIGADVYSRHFLESGSKPWRLNFEKQSRGYRPPSIVDGILVKWAYSPSDTDVASGFTVNANGIALASNKYMARKKMVEEGVPTPTTTIDSFEVCEWLSSGKIVIGRPFQHQGGSDFYVINSASDLNRYHTKCNYYSEFFPKTNEYRVHVAHGKVLVCQEKVPTNDSVRLDVPAAWNHATGNFVFEVIQWSDFKKDVVKAACTAVKALGLDMGAVDVLYDSNTGLAVVTEVNTSPSLEGYALSRYAKYFKWVERHEGGDHWDFTQYNLAKSYAWTNGQLDE